MRPNKLQLNDEQKKSISVAKTGPYADKFKQTPYTEADHLLRYTLPSANALDAMPKEESRKIWDNYNKADDSNRRERNTFKNANVSIATLRKKQEHMNYDLDFGVSGDALARLKAGKPAKYMRRPFPDADKK
jgi:hypothetical protein